MLVLTIDHAPGHRIVQILGEVIGATIRPDNPYVEGVKSLDGAATRTDDVVRTRQYVVRADAAEAVGAVHGEVFGDVRPASTMVVVTGLLDPRWLVEVEAEAVVRP